MLRILTWNSNTGFEKVPTQDLLSFGQDTTPAPVPCAKAQSKRKRSSDGATLPVSVESKAVKLAAIEVNKFSVSQPPQNSANASDTPSVLESSTSQLLATKSSSANNVNMEVDAASPSPEVVKSKEEAQLATMRQTISTQLNLEILLKHRELRLIDQELAKCQIALEQLRRCTEIPYPALQQPSEQVSSGKGSAVRKASDKYAARSPAPWGVVDGPYTRHYAKWLLPDPQFDGGEVETPRLISHAAAHGHSTRGHYTDFAQMVGKTSRAQRALNAGLPAGYAEPKQKPTGPMILKRKSDGKMVKLVCPDCDRFDFGSAQGFINHCRIGHQRNYASHDAAAEGCGQPVELDENGAVKGASADTAPAAPTATAPVMPTVPATAPTTPAAITPVPPPSFNSAAVHPLVRSAHSTPKEVLSRPLVKGGCVPKPDRSTNKVKISASSPPACDAAPNLAAYIEKQGLKLNLQDAVTDARTKSDVLDESIEDDMEVDSPLPIPSANSRHPHGAGKKHPVKSTDRGGKMRKPSFTQPQSREDAHGSFSSVNTPSEEQHFPSFMPLLPSPTNESTQAPSLIDDDEEMDPQSPPSSDEIDDGEGDVHFHVRDDEQIEEGHELRPADMSAPTTTCARPDQAPQPLQATLTRPLSSKSERPISFVAEQPRSEDEHDRKRRKVGK